MRHYGYFSTIFIIPGARRQGLAIRLIEHVNSWFLENHLDQAVYNTAHDHAALIKLFEKQGYRPHLREGEMVQLIKQLSN